MVMVMRFGGAFTNDSSVLLSLETPTARVPGEDTGGGHPRALPRGSISESYRMTAID